MNNLTVYREKSCRKIPGTTKMQPVTPRRPQTMSVKSMASVVRKRMASSTF